MRRKHKAFQALLGLSLLFATPGHADTVDTYWNGAINTIDSGNPTADDQSWMSNDGAEQYWSHYIFAGGTPGGGGGGWAGDFPGEFSEDFNVFVDNPDNPRGAVRLNARWSRIFGTNAIQTLTLDSDDTLRFDSSQLLILRAGILNNDGTIELSGTGFTDTGIDFEGPNQQINGSGVIRHTAGNEPWGGTNIIRSRDEGVITHAATHTMRGTLRVLDNQGGMLNHGSIIADVPDRFIQINPGNNGDTFVNEASGILRAENQADLHLLDGIFINNANTPIMADNATVIIGQNVTFTGGRLASMNGGEIRLRPDARNVTGGLTLNGVTFDPGTTIIHEGAIGNDDIIYQNGLTNHGQYQFTSTNPLTMRFDGSQSLQGSGTITLDGANAIRPEADGQVLAHEVTHVIQGMGDIGDNVGGFINRGSLLANFNLSGNPRALDIDPGADGFINAPGGVMHASNLGFFRFFDGEFLNQSTIQLDVGSTLDVESGANVTDGTVAGEGIIKNDGTFTSNTGLMFDVNEIQNNNGLITTNGGDVQYRDNSLIDRGNLGGNNNGTHFVGNGMELHDVTIDAGGKVEVQNAEILNVDFRLHNDGVLTLNSTGSFTQLIALSQVQFRGTGEINTGVTNGNNFIFPANPAHNLTQFEGHTIRGALGLLYDPVAQQGVGGFTNNGEIIADDNFNRIFIHPGNGEQFANNNIIRAEGGEILPDGTRTGGLTLQGGLFTNRNGVIEATNNSTVHIINGAIIDEGLLSTSGNGLILIDSRSTLQFAPDFATTEAPLLDDMTLTAGSQMKLANASTVSLALTPVINGTFMLDSQGSDTTVKMINNVRIDGSGQIVTTDFGVNRILVDAGRTFTISENIEFIGSGDILGGTGELVNRGQIIANGINQGIVVAPDTGTFKVRNHGLIHAQGQAQLDIAAVEFRGDSVFRNEASGELRIDTKLALTDGATLDNFGLISGSGVLDLNMELVSNSGTISPGQSPGILEINGSVDSLSAAELIIEIGGTTPGAEYDQLVLTGSFDAAGSLIIDLIDGFLPSPTDVFTIISAEGGISGNFAEIIDGSITTLNGEGVFAAQFDQLNGQLILGDFVATIPEPSTLLVYCIGLGWGITRRRATA